MSVLYEEPIAFLDGKSALREPLVDSLMQLPRRLRASGKSRLLACAQRAF